MGRHFGHRPFKGNIKISKIKWFEMKLVIKMKMGLVECIQNGIYSRQNINWMNDREISKQQNIAFEWCFWKCVCNSFRLNIKIHSNKINTDPSQYQNSMQIQSVVLSFNSLFQNHPLECILHQHCSVASLWTTSFHVIRMNSLSTLHNFSSIKLISCFVSHSVFQFVSPKKLTKRNA